MDKAFFSLVGSLGQHQLVERERAFERAAQRAYEQALFGGRREFTVQGYCAGCRKVTPLKVDLLWGDGVTPNWRERLECPCGLINRTRAALDFLDGMTEGRPDARIYATEQVTALFAHLRAHHPGAVGSEFLRDGTAPGATNGAGLRHEDLTALSFPDASFDVVLSFDVLEHVPMYQQALAEIARVLAPGGRLLASFPFDTSLARTLRRASIRGDGSVEHHLPPEFHGDPVADGGCLCFQVFGWDVLDELRAAGFSGADVAFYWSAERGYLGPNQLLVIASR